MATKKQGATGTRKNSAEEGSPNGGSPSALGNTGGKTKREKEELRWKRRQKRLERLMKRDGVKPTIRDQAPVSVSKAMVKAEQGSCQHLKVIFELADMENMPDPAEAKKNRSLAEILLEKVGVETKQS